MNEKNNHVIRKKIKDFAILCRILLIGVITYVNGFDSNTN